MTKKLTKAQRHIAYMLFLAELQSEKLDYESSDGFCFMAYHLFGLKDDNGGYDGVIKKHFPELQKRKPKIIFSNGLWFQSNDNKEGLQKRIELLNQCIIETYE